HTVLQKLALYLDDAAGDTPQRLAALIDIGDEETRAHHVVRDMLALVLAQPRLMMFRGKVDLVVGRIDTQKEPLRFDNLNLEDIALHQCSARDNHIWQNGRRRFATAQKIGVEMATAGEGV